MMFIELFVPKGALSEEQRRDLSKRLITEFTTEEEAKIAPAAVIEANRALQQVVVHEPETWIAGGHLVDPSEPPRYVVRVSVPAAWRKEMSAEVISRITRVLVEADQDPQRLYQEPIAWVHVIGVPEGGYGTFGQVMKSSDLVKMITRPFRESPDREARLKAAPPGTGIDPVCGMAVPLADVTITLEHNGTTYVFCSAGCRAVFVEELRAASPE